MDKSIKFDAIKEMAKGDAGESDAHMATCPRCGYEWMMGEEDEYEGNEEESEDYEDEE